MNTISFLLAFTVISALLFAYYFLFLRKEKQFQSNRFFLLAILPVSAILPLIEFNFFQAKEISPILGATLETITITSEAVNNWAYGYDSMIGLLYVCISAGFLSFFLFRMTKLILFIKKSPEKEKIAGATVVFGDKKVTPASFGSYIFWNKEHQFEELQHKQILAHELCHIRQLHSIDILFLELWKVLLWFHPLIYLIERELKNIHEYQADQAAAHTGEEQNYIQVLLSQTLGQSLQLSHNFFQLPIKRRIMMLMHKPNAQRTRVKYLFLIPFFLTIFLACTTEQASKQEKKEIVTNISENEDEKKELETPLDKNIQAVNISATPDIGEFIAVDTEPKPKNINDVKKLVGYPQIAIDASIHGQVVIRVLLDEKGNYVRHKVVNQIHPILSEAVEKHIDKLQFTPALKNGEAIKFWVNIPFNFMLKG